MEVEVEEKKDNQLEKGHDCETGDRGLVVVVTAEVRGNGQISEMQK